MTGQTLDVDAERLRETFESYAGIGATGDGGLHRLALSAADRAARDRFVSDLRALGLSVRVDELGNVFGRRAGRDAEAAPVLIGSHLDSQPYGGRYDGQLGVLVALETLRRFEDLGVETDRPVEIVDWTNEEGSRFQPSMMGSGVYAGAHDAEAMLARTDRDGVSVGEALERIDYDGDAPCEPPEAGVHAFLELHVEQGPTLDDRGLSVGVVDGVYGLAWLRAVVEGEADHAGPTPMHARRDALAAATDAVGEIQRLPNRLSADAVATVGEFRVEPDSINVVPGRATFTVDLRSEDDGVVDRGIERTRAELDAACERHGVEYELERLSRHRPVAFAARVRAAADRAVEATGVPAIHLVSGAGHDAQHLQSVTDAGMLFVPSVDGRTHAEAEFTEWEDCLAGARAFANATLDLATAD
ncbi:MAG: M20 family metallo-hydrolase [Haloarculaceae archaeon]